MNSFLKKLFLNITFLLFLSLNVIANDLPKFIPLSKDDVSVEMTNIIVKGIEIDIRVTSNNWEVSSLLNGVEIANGNNLIGTISAGETWAGNIDVNITNYIPNFAIEDCTLLIEVTINLTYQPLIDIPLSFIIEQSEPYEAPF